MYNLASPSFVPRSWEHPVETAEFAAVGVTSLLEAIRAVDPAIRVYQASSSEIFGEPARGAADGVDAALARDAVRRREGVRALHRRLVPPALRPARERRDPLQPRVAAPARSTSCRARSRTRAAAISLGLEQELALGDLDAQRDWGYAGDYVEAMWLMLQQDEPGDYVIATGELHTVASSSRSRSRTSASTGRRTSGSTTRSKRGTGRAAPPRRRRVEGPRRASAGRRSIGFEELVRLLVDAAVARLTSS